MEQPATRLVVIADDFGRTASINEAIARACDEGIVRGASLMSTEIAFDEAARIAKERPDLGVGLHAAFCDAHSALPPGEIPGIADANGRLGKRPALTGIRYALFGRRLLPQVERELREQFARLDRAGIRPSHVDGHHHLHIHPALFRILCREAAARGVRWVRIPEGDPKDGRALEWAVFGLLARRNRGVARRAGLRWPDRVHGLSRTGRIDEAYLLDLLPRLRPGWNELFVHPDAADDAGRRELQAVISPRVRERIAASKIVLSGYGDVDARAPRRAGTGERS